MSCAPWRCDECGAKTVEQAWIVYAPMNRSHEGAHALLTDQQLWAQYEESYWCPDCKGECSPTREERS